MLSQPARCCPPQGEGYNFKAEPKAGIPFAFTQLLWRSTTKMGCAYKKCGALHWLLCYFDPHGSAPGQFVANVLPLAKSPPPPPPARAPPAGTTSSVDRLWLSAHNSFRKLHTNTPALVWDSGLAASALAFVVNCPKGYDPTNDQLGENIIFEAADGHRAPAPTIQKAWYDNAVVGGGWSARCVGAGAGREQVLQGQGVGRGSPGRVGSLRVPRQLRPNALWLPPLQFSYDYMREPTGGARESVWAFTQLLWKGTHRVGCAYQNCNSAWTVVCRYHPWGNVVSQYMANVLPRQS